MKNLASIFVQTSVAIRTATSTVKSCTTAKEWAKMSATFCAANYLNGFDKECFDALHAATTHNKGVQFTAHILWVGNMETFKGFI